MDKYYEKRLCECVYKNGPGECMDLWKKYEKKTGKQGDDLECIVEAMMDMEESPAEEIVEYAEEEYYIDDTDDEEDYDFEKYEYFECECTVTWKGTWDYNIEVEAINNWSGETMNFHYEAWYNLGETRGLFENGVWYDELQEGQEYLITYSPRKWVENYETGGWMMGNFIISVETMLD